MEIQHSDIRGSDQGADRGAGSSGASAGRTATADAAGVSIPDRAVPSTGGTVVKKWKRGEIDPVTGKYYWGWQRWRGRIYHTWLVADKFENKIIREKQSQRRKYLKAKLRRKKLVRKYFRGDLNPESGKYFIVYDYRTGREIWGTEGDLEKFRKSFRKGDEARAEKNKRSRALREKAYECSPEKSMAQKQREYRNKNKTRLSAQLSQRIKSDPVFKLRRNCSNAVWFALKRVGLGKKKSSVAYLGCSGECLRLHLESQFKTGMSWDNWNIHGWHIDHKIPVASAKNEEQLIRLLHYTNLQPLWAIDNLKKSDKILPEFQHLVAAVV